MTTTLEKARADARARADAMAEAMARAEANGVDTSVFTLDEYGDLANGTLGTIEWFSDYFLGVCYLRWSMSAPHEDLTAVGEVLGSHGWHGVDVREFSAVMDSGVIYTRFEQPGPDEWD